MRDLVQGQLWAIARLLVGQAPAVLMQPLLQRLAHPFVAAL
jgi:hypothetical protein